jgi:phosphate/sulfate permease
MNYRLLLIFLVCQAIEFSIFYAISIVAHDVANNWGYDLSATKVFAGIVGIDIIATAIFFGSEISEFINDLFGESKV